MFSLISAIFKSTSLHCAFFLCFFLLKKSHNSLSRAFKQMSQDKILSKPKLVFDDVDRPVTSLSHDKKSQTYKHFQKKLADEREKMKTKKSALLRKENEVKHTTSIKAEAPTINIDTLDVPVIDSVFTPETATNKSKWEDEQSHEKSRKRKSRWGPESSSSLQLAGDNGQG